MVQKRHLTPLLTLWGYFPSMYASEILVKLGGTNPLSEPMVFCRQVAWGRLSIKKPSYQYRDPHVKDKTVSRPSYL